MSKPAFSKWLFDMGSQDSFADVKPPISLFFSQTMGFGMYLCPRTQDKSLFPMIFHFVKFNICYVDNPNPRPDKCRRNQSVMFQVEEVIIANHLACLK